MLNTRLIEGNYNEEISLIDKIEANKLSNNKKAILLKDDLDLIKSEILTKCSEGLYEIVNLKVNKSTYDIIISILSQLGYNIGQCNSHYGFITFDWK